MINSDGRLWSILKTFFHSRCGSGSCHCLRKEPLLQSDKGLVLLLLLAASGCLGPHYVRTEPSSRLPVPKLTGLTEHVVVVSIDGLRPDAISASETPTLNRLAQEGSYTF